MEIIRDLSPRWKFHEVEHFNLSIDERENVDDADEINLVLGAGEINPQVIQSKDGMECTVLPRHHLNYFEIRGFEVVLSIIISAKRQKGNLFTLGMVQPQQSVGFFALALSQQALKSS